jgi:hypothetical protein
MGDKNKSYKLLFSHAQMVEDPQRALRRCHLERSQEVHAMLSETVKTWPAQWTDAIRLDNIC